MEAEKEGGLEVHVFMDANGNCSELHSQYVMWGQF